MLRLSAGHPRPCRDTLPRGRPLLSACSGGPPREGALQLGLPQGLPEPSQTGKAHPGKTRRGHMKRPASAGPEPPPPCPAPPGPGAAHGTHTGPASWRDGWARECPRGADCARPRTSCASGSVRLVLRKNQKLPAHAPVSPPAPSPSHTWPAAGIRTESPVKTSPGPTQAETNTGRRAVPVTRPRDGPSHPACPAGCLHGVAAHPPNPRTPQATGERGDRST